MMRVQNTLEAIDILIPDDPPRNRNDGTGRRSLCHENIDVPAYGRTLMLHLKLHIVLNKTIILH